MHPDLKITLAKDFPVAWGNLPADRQPAIRALWSACADWHLLARQEQPEAMIAGFATNVQIQFRQAGQALLVRELVLGDGWVGLQVEGEPTMRRVQLFDPFRPTQAAKIADLVDVATNLEKLMGTVTSEQDLLRKCYNNVLSASHGGYALAFINAFRQAGIEWAPPELGEAPFQDLNAFASAVQRLAELAAVPNRNPMLQLATTLCR